MKQKLINFSLMGLFVLVMLLNAGNSFAVDSLKGCWSLGLYSALNHSEVETAAADTYKSDSKILNASLGYYLTDHVQINFSPTFATNETEGAEISLNNYFGSLQYNFYRSGWQAVPYVGFQAGMTSIDFKYEDDSYSDTGYSFGFMGGLKAFLTENLSLDIEYNWLWAPDLTADLTMSTIFIGFTWYFGGN
jgi:opacity protein-like surface antigen